MTAIQSSDENELTNTPKTNYHRTEQSPKKPASTSTAKKSNTKQRKLHGSFVDLFYFADRFDLLLLTIGFYGAVFAGGLYPIFALIIGKAVTAFDGETVDMDQVNIACIYFGTLAVCLGIAHYLQHVCFSMSAERQMRALRKQTLHAILRQEIGWFDTTASGELASRISGDTIVIQEGIGEKLGEGIRSFSQFLSGFSIGFIKSWKLALVMSVVLPLMVASLGFIMYNIRMAAVKSQQAYAKAGAVANEVLSSIRTIQVFGAEERASARYAEHVAQAKEAQMKSGIKIGIGSGTTVASIFFTYALGLWYGGVLIANQPEKYEVGTILSVFYAILIGSTAMGIATPNFIAIGRAKGIANAIVGIVKRQSAIDPTSMEGETIGKILLKGDFSISDVDFAYPNRPEVKVLSNYNLTIRAGTTTAIVGESGSGKSTLISLLQRFYDPLSGSIYLDGKNLRDLNVGWLRSQFGVVSQEPVLFGDTIFKNVCCGHPSPESVSIDEVIHACQLANADEFIRRFPDGYHTFIGENGVQLSGGQKQRIVIARAIIKDPPILLLDEATSALDNESQAKVQTALDNLLKIKQRTTIIVAHRLTTIRKADQIAVIKNGKVVEIGTHEHLLHDFPTGSYHQLIQKQKDFVDEAAKVNATPPRRNIMARSDDIAPSSSKLPRRTELEMELSGIARRIWKIFASSNKFLVALAFCFAALSGCYFPCVALVLTEYVDAMMMYEGNELEDKIRLFTYVMVGIAIIAWILRFVQINLFTFLSESLIEKMRNRVFSAMLHQRIEWFDLEQHSIGALMERLASDPPKLKTIAGENLGRLIQTMATFSCATITALLLGSWQITVILLFILPLLVWAFVRRAKRRQGATVESQRSLETASAIAASAISSIRTITSLGLTDYIVNQYDKYLEKPSALALRQGQSGGVLTGFAQLLTIGTYGLIFYYGSILVNSGTIEFDRLFRSLFVIMLAAQSMGHSASFAGDRKLAKQAAYRMFSVIDKECEESASSMEYNPPKDIGGEIVIKNLTFAYRSRPYALVLKQLNATIPKGKITALVGPSGSGKSSLIGLLERLYEPLWGDIILDGTNIKDLSLHALRQQFGYVGQEPTLFSTSILENIQFGDTNASIEEIQTAARLANAHNFITQLPNGYDTQVGLRGTQLSGGQKQRIAIARAILRKPRILILDEATSALDTISEAHIQEAIDNFTEKSNCTVIVIAHRLSTIRNADNILVFDKGEIVEQGSHRELLTSETGSYRNLILSSVK